MPRILLALALVTLLAACATPPSHPSAGATHAAYSADFRRPSPQTNETIFSPVPWPAPSSVRTAAGLPGPDYWQNRADYQIQATLDAAKHELRGEATITYTNDSPEPVYYLWLHLEQNLFKKDSDGALLTQPGARFGNRDGHEGGLKITSLEGIDITTEPRPDANGSIQVFEEGQLNDQGRLVFPLAGNQNFRLSEFGTLGRLDLPTPVPGGGGQIRFRVAWSFEIPTYGSDRMGILNADQGEIFQMAQWFPAVAVYDDVHAWNTLPYLGQGEFYTNFGNFDVKLTVPRDHIVAATGVLQNPQEVLTLEQIDRLKRARESQDTVVIRSADEVGSQSSRPAGDGPLTWHFRAADTRTFAFTTSAAFIWDAAHIADRGQTPSEDDDDWRMPEGTLVQSVYPKEALPLWSKSTEMLKFSIEGYGKRWFTYPYPSATNANGVCGGMEYPMLIFCRERKDEHGLYGVTTHEIGHNWFPMVVNTDERRHAWMDEGFNTFINFYSNQERFPEGKKPQRGDAAAFVPSMLEADQQPMETPADQVAPGRLGMLEYAKTAAGLVLLREQILGPERFDAAFRRYIEIWAFKSPQPSDFFRCMEDASGEDLGWFWRGWFYGTGTLDQGIDTASTDENTGTARATFVNRGDLVMPVIYRVTYNDGSTEMRRLPVQAWFTSNRFTAYWDCGKKRVTKVEIDPDQVFPDTDRGNNNWH